MTTDRTVFNIPEANLPRLQREVTKLSAKAEKLAGWGFDLVIFGINYRDNDDGSKTKLFEVSLDVATIKMGDWSFQARIDHSQDTGNIIRAVPNVIIDERYRSVAPNCEHCNHKRLRRDTFVLLNNETGETKQVGSTCLSDFLGHDAAHLGRVAELAGYANELAKASETATEHPGLQDHRYVVLQEYLEHVAAAVRIDGWISSKTAWENPSLEASRHTAMNRMHAHREVTDTDRELAEKALAWAQTFAEKDSLNDYEHNVLVIAEASVIEYRACGLAASIVGVYSKKFTPRAQSVQLNMEPLIALFQKAGSKLKNPKVKIDLGGYAIELTMAKPHHKVPGSINVKAPSQGYGIDVPWYGRIMPDGKYNPSRSAPAGIEQELLTLAADPAGIMAKYGHRTGRCCMCNLPLTDQRSTAVGYGATCAANYGLHYPTVKELAAA